MDKSKPDKTSEAKGEGMKLKIVVIIAAAAWMTVGFTLGAMWGTYRTDRPVINEHNYYMDCVFGDYAQQYMSDEELLAYWNEMAEYTAHCAHKGPTEIAFDLDCDYDL